MCICSHVDEGACGEEARRPCQNTWSRSYRQLWATQYGFWELNSSLLQGLFLIILAYDALTGGKLDLVRLIPLRFFDLFPPTGVHVPGTRSDLEQHQTQLTMRILDHAAEVKLGLRPQGYTSTSQRQDLPFLYCPLSVVHLILPNSLLEEQSENGIVFTSDACLTLGISSLKSNFMGQGFLLCASTLV